MPTFEDFTTLNSALGVSARNFGLDASVRYLADQLSCNYSDSNVSVLTLLHKVARSRTRLRAITDSTKVSTLIQLARCDWKTHSERRTLIQLRGFLSDIRLLSELSHSVEANLEADWCIALGWLGDLGAIEWLKSRTCSPDPSVRIEAAVSLAGLGDESVLNILSDVCDKSVSCDYRSLIAATALCKLCQTKGVNYLLLESACLIDSDSNTRDNFLANVSSAVNRVECDFDTFESHWWSNYIKMCVSRCCR